eukprot:TRINITY_DN4086_c0_g1_i9.p1 TRINITY_DN4086_c0_g1~~TRINITY_DN4086_c0_g1_i9.p1  ORF type:complete len:583 (-),score=171.43 TRINITY_DN4086_c0_g1_i9:525-2273(-)
MFRFASNLKKKGLPVESKTWQVAYEDLEFFKTLGEGNFGTVFHGTYFGTDVAIKKINDDEQKYLDREVMILKSIRHPNIVQLMGVCEHSSGLYLVTELLPGGTLRKKLKNPAVEISWPTRINICIDLARALTFLHSKEIIHRDLKSKNVLLDDHFKVKICDFGLARTMEMDGVPRRMTMCGTDDWMAPEIAAGNPYTELSDVFSFGVILLEVIFRQKPNQDAIRKSLLYGVDVRTVIERKPKDVPDRLFDVATRACAMDWASRPQMANCLQELKVTLTEYTAAEASKAQKQAAAAPPPVSIPQQTPNAAPLSPRSSAAIHHTPPPPSYPSHPSSSLPSSPPSLSIATTAPSTPQQTSNAAPLSPRSSAAPAPPPLPKSAPPPPPPPPSHTTPKPPHATSAATSSSTAPSPSSSDPSDLTDEKLIEYALTSSIRRRSTIGNHHEHLALALQQSSQQQQQPMQQQPMQQTKPSNAPTRPGGPPPKPPPPKPSGPPPNAPPNQGPISPPGRDKILHADRPGQSFRVGGQGPNSFEIFVNPLVGQRGTIDASDLKTFDEPDQSGSSGNRSKDQKPSLAHKLFGKSG